MYGVHTTQIGVWKKQAMAELAQVFTSRRSSIERTQKDLTATLYQQIGHLKVELDWLKKKRPVGNGVLRALVEPDNDEITINRQCELLGLARSAWYYQWKPENPEDLRLMYLMDEQYHHRRRCDRRAQSLLRVLQREAATSIVGLPNAAGSLRRADSRRYQNLCAP